MRGAAVIVSAVKPNAFMGASNMRWSADDEILTGAGGFFFAFFASPLDRDVTAAMNSAICTSVVAAGIAIRQPGYEAKLTPEAVAEMVAAAEAASTAYRPRSGKGRNQPSSTKSPVVPSSRLHLCLTCGEHLLMKSAKQKSLGKRYTKIFRFPQDAIFSCGGERLRSEDREPLVEAAASAAASAAIERRRGRGGRGATAPAVDKQNNIESLRKKFETEMIALTQPLRAKADVKSEKQRTSGGGSRIDLR